MALSGEGAYHFVANVGADGDLVFVANQDSNDLMFVNAVLLQVVRSFKLNDGPRGIAFLAAPVGQAWAGADFDRSGEVDFADFLVFAIGFGTSSADFAFDKRLDDDDFLLFAMIINDFPLLPMISHDFP